jgi:hypothetical protein
MELGFMLYFLIVFGFGGLLLIGLVVYFVREFLIREDRPAWSVRTRQSKAVLLVSSFLATGLLLILLRMIWVTRIGAVPGRYVADGVWGNATLEVRQDGDFVETWHFKNEYNGKAKGDGSTQGHWRDEGRDWLTRDIVLEPFTPLAEYDRDHTYSTNRAIVTGYSGATSIDPGADITFVK